MHPEVDVGAIAGLHQAQLARIADAVAVPVVPEPESRLGGLRFERVHQHVARVGARGVLAHRRPEALVALRADRRHAEAARRAVGERRGDKFVGHGFSLEVPGPARVGVEIVARAVHAIPLESGKPGRVVGPPEMDGLIQRNRAKRVGSLQPEPLIDGDDVREIAFAAAQVDRGDRILQMRYAVVVECVRAGLAAQLERTRRGGPRVHPVEREGGAVGARDVVPHEQDAGRSIRIAARVELVPEILRRRQRGAGNVRRVVLARDAQNAGDGKDVSRGARHGSLGRRFGRCVGRRRAAR